MHRAILGVTDPAIEVDHRSGDGLNNRRGNLREATRAQNSRNLGLPRNSTSGFKGVSFTRSKGQPLAKPWQASINVNWKGYHLGYFATAAAAARAYDAAARVHFGEFARLNFPATTEACHAL